MEIDISKISSVEKKIKLSFKWDEVSDTYNKVVNKLRKSFKLDGFRPGKVPLSLAKRHLAPNIQYEFINKVVEDTFKKTMEDNKITEFIDSGIVDIDFQEGKSFGYTIKVEFDPVIKLINYKKGFNVKKNEYMVNDEDVEFYMKSVQEEHAEAKEITDGAQIGHYVICDLQEIDEKNIPIIGNKSENQTIKLGEGLFVEPGISNLIGASAGQSIHIKIKNKNGQEIGYAVKVLRVEEHNLPEINDQWVKDNLQSVDSVTAWKKQLKDSMKRDLVAREENDLNAEIKEYFINNIEFEIPQSRIDHYLEKLVEEMKGRAKGKKVDEEDIKAKNEAVAEKAIRWYLIEEKLKKSENFEVTIEEIEGKINEMCEQYPEDQRETFKNYYKNESFTKQLEYQIMDKKIFDHLKEFAKIKVEKISISELRNKV